MSTEIIRTMEQLIQLNKSLYEIAVQKTDIVKKGDMEAFQQLQQNEQKHILAIQKINKDREQAVATLVPTKENPTITDCLPHVPTNDRDKLTKLKDELVAVLTDLQQQNDLNQQLIHQSLQFINMSVHMLLPQEQQFNYGPPTNKKQQTETKRIFQSEA